ncbi:hypothetical protein NEMBOFW57_010584 [Staphylotrichum longicolle]|uniref:Uncharacterized protein n=1 Tax=Staphylotrichum longicolle TaxID=669026 RepID=A0AAD4HVE5_9PEZI|nr:hypothetical protein NEMBOFW57_010584 [Staphylotrichum longicolle]
MEQEKPILTHCVHELFSLFILAIAAQISDIGGITTELPPHMTSGGRRVWDNTNLTALAEQAVQANLVTSLDEALALVVPAFAHHNLLPKPKQARERYANGSEQDRVKWTGMAQ